jgi:hypothetical protein
MIRRACNPWREKLLAAGTLDDGEREIVEAMLGGE